MTATARAVLQNSFLLILTKVVRSIYHIKKHTADRRSPIAFPLLAFRSFSIEVFRFPRFTDVLFYMTILRKRIVVFVRFIPLYFYLPILYMVSDPPLALLFCPQASWSSLPRLPRFSLGATAIRISSCLFNDMFLKILVSFLWNLHLIQRFG